ncbi:MAG TPA: aldehyde dehydrogenase family protein [Galbitalea sp.]
MTTTRVPPMIPALIGGEAVAARSGETIDVHNPATGELLGRIPNCATADVNVAVTAAQAAFPAWRRLPATERAKCLYELAGTIEGAREELAQLDADDNGTPVSELEKDVDIGAAELRYFAGLALLTEGKTVPTGWGRVNYTLREPFGVVGRIIPFNHPLLFATMKIAAPLIAGNTLVLKPSEHTSLTALRLAEDFKRIFPPGVINVITGYGRDAGDSLVAHPDVRRIAFIGLAETGRAIQARAAEVGVKTVTLELGGKNPIVIFPDADLDKAVDGAIRGMNFTFQGQSCGSTSRLMVHRDIRSEFVDRLVDKIAALRVGLPRDRNTEVGSLVNRQQRDKVAGYIELGLQEGARLLVGGTIPDDTVLANGFFLSPAVFADVKPGMRLAREEIFGPVLAVIEFDTYETGIALANDTRFGLTASVYTEDLRIAHSFARDVEAGFVWVNDSGKHFLGTPFGGYKDSGIGREEDTEELHSYTQIKNVNIAFDS